MGRAVTGHAVMGRAVIGRAVMRRDARGGWGGPVERAWMLAHPNPGAGEYRRHVEAAGPPAVLDRALAHARAYRAAGGAWGYPWVPRLADRRFFRAYGAGDLVAPPRSWRRRGSRCRRHDRRAVGRRQRGGCTAGILVPSTRARREETTMTPEPRPPHAAPPAADRSRDPHTPPHARPMRTARPPAPRTPLPPPRPAPPGPA